MNSMTSKTFEEMQDKSKETNPAKPQYQLSYSSASLLMSCEQQYWHKKVAKTPIDADADESTENFDIGKAFHQYLENTKHTKSKSHTAMVATVCKQYNVFKHRCMIQAMIEAYLDLHIESKLRVIFCELQLSDENTLGFIDVGLVDDRIKEFWVGDMKTAGKIDWSLNAKLPFDYQLNLYSHYAEAILGFFPELKGYKFAGCRYRVTTKPDIMRKDNETDESFIRRTKSFCKSVDYVVPVQVLNPDEIYRIHKENRDRMVQLHNGEVPRKNLGACFNWYRACQWWSQCRGRTYTESKEHCVAPMDLKELKRFNSQINNNVITDEDDCL
jgi:hypothetical protein